MEEETNHCIRQLFAKQGGQKHKMIIMNPDDIARRVQLYYFMKHDLVGALVGIKKILFINDVGWKVMEQRPENRIAKSIIK